MTALRQRMLDDMHVRHMAPKTIRAYLGRPLAGALLPGALHAPGGDLE
jgi:hypothetical protein